MEQQQESILERRAGEERQKRPISRVRQWVYAVITALGLSTAVGCGGSDASTKPRVPEKMETTKKIEEIPPKIRMLLGENAVRLQNPATVQCGRDIFLVDSDGRRLWRLVDGPMLFGRCGTVDRPCIDSGVVYGTHASVMYEGKTMEQITTCYVGRRPDGTQFVTLARKWILDTTIDDLKERIEKKKEHQREQKKQEILQGQDRLVKIVSISGKTFTDQRGVVWTHSGGYFPSLSNGIVHRAKVRVENPQWGRDARGSDILIGGTQILRWKVEGKGYVEFRAPVERNKKMQ